MHVDRLVNADDFIRRCKDLNVEVSLGELEHYPESTEGIQRRRLDEG